MYNDACHMIDITHAYKVGHIRCRGVAQGVLLHIPHIHSMTNTTFGENTFTHHVHVLVN